MPNQPIPVADANLMITSYFSYMQGLGVSMAQQTQSVSFEKNALKAWLEEIWPYADELRVFMGEYPVGHVHAGRTTVILWPYKDGNPSTKPGPLPAGEIEIDPFNDGSLNP